MPHDVAAWADGLRRAHFPPERNRLRAHVTLFHALPPSAEGEVRRLLGEITSAPPPSARIAGVMKLGGGTALRIDSEAMVAIHREIAERMRGLLTSQDMQPARLHVTIQNKVSSEAARALYEALAPTIVPRDFRFRGIGLYGYDGGDWLALRDFPFRGHA
jgi:hypothetical protein